MSKSQRSARTMVHHVFGGEGVPCILGRKTRTPIIVGKANSFQLLAVGDVWPTLAATEPMICALDHVHMPLAVCGAFAKAVSRTSWTQTRPHTVARKMPLAIELG